MVGFIIGIIVYFLALRLGAHMLSRNDIELPKFSRWLVLNTFALILSYAASLPF